MFVFSHSKISSLTPAAPLTAAALFVTHLALAATPALAAPDAISPRLEMRAPQPTTAGAMPPSHITNSGNSLAGVQPLTRAKSRSVATRPNQINTETTPLLAQVSMPAALASNPAIAARTTSTPAAAPQPLEATIVKTPVVKIPVVKTTAVKTTVTMTLNTTVAAPASTPAALASRAGSAALMATINKPAAKKSEDDLLLAQIDADLSSTQTRLNTSSQKLSAGQRQLMSFSNTLRSAIIEAGDDGAGLHPFVRVASRYAGTPYVWGGESRYGFDCSGFIIRVMRDLGYKALPHSAAEQFKYGQPIAQGLLKPGDIVFFANTYKRGISHVGIYIGKGRFIHAASTLQGTIVSSLSASPYRQKYAGARRLLTVRKKA